MIKFLRFTPRCCLWRGTLLNQSQSLHKKEKECCHDESWYQRTSLSVDCKYEHGRGQWFASAKPPTKVCLTSPPSPREKEATAQATHRGDGYQTSLREEQVCHKMNWLQTLQIRSIPEVVWENNQFLQERTQTTSPTMFAPSTSNQKETTSLARKEAKTLTFTSNHGTISSLN